MKLTLLRKTIIYSKFSAIAIALLFYSIISVVYFGLPILRHLSTRYVGNGTDPFIYMWFFDWWPYSLLHGLNPFYTHMIWSPDGFNLAWSTSLPGLSLLVAPVTLTLGPTTSYNLLMLLSPVLAALAAYILINHLTGRFWPSLLGGYIFGYSSYEIGQLQGHLNLSFIFAIPLCIYLVVLLFEGKIKSIKFLLWMSLLLSFQFLVSTEVFASLTVLGLLVLGIAISLFPSVRSHIISKGKMLLGAYALMALIVSPYLYFVFALGIPSAPINPPSSFSTDLLNIFIPTPMTLIGHNSFDAIAKTFAGNYSEEGAYLGLPVILILIIYTARYWHTRVGKLLVISLCCITIASFGPLLRIAGIGTINMPWKIFTHFPLINQALPQRFMLYAWLIVAVVVGIFLVDSSLNKFFKYGIVALSIIFLVPNIHARYWVSSVDEPEFFAQGLYKDFINPGENVLVIPYGYNGQSMLWQADTGMYFRMAGGYVGYSPSSFTDWDIVQTFYNGDPSPDYHEQLMGFLATHDVKAVIVADSAANVFRELFDGIGLQPQKLGGVTIYRVPRQMILDYQNMNVTLARQADRTVQFEALYAAAGDFLRAGGSENDLYPLALEERGYLKGYGGYARDIPSWNWTRFGGWLGLWGDDIGVGISGTYQDILPIIHAYEGQAEKIYFPYPEELSPQTRKTSQGELLMIFPKNQFISNR